MEDSRKAKRDGEKELSTPSPHVDDEKGKKSHSIKDEGRRKERGQKNYSKIIALEHVRGYSLHKLRL